MSDGRAWPSGSSPPVSVLIPADNGRRLDKPSPIAAAATPEGLATLTRGLYFSAITFTTIGYANVAPIGAGSRPLVGIESFLGAALMALLVAVLARRITR